MARLHRLEFGAYWRFFLKQPPSFWLISFYLLFEYVRPQSIYPSLDVLPWSQTFLIGCAAAVLAEGRLFKSFDSSDAWLVVFTAVLIASSFTAYFPDESFAELQSYLNWVLIFVLITRSVDSEGKFFFFYFLFLLFSLKMSQHASRSWFGAGLQFRSWGATGAPGFFQNSGEMAIQMTIFLPLSIYFAQALKPHLSGLTKKWKYWMVLAVPLSAVFALLASSSRGGQLGGLAVGAWMLFRSKARVRGFLAAIFIAGAVFLLLPEEQRARFEEMGSDETSETRIYHWKNGIKIANAHPVLGVGYANWLPYYYKVGYTTGRGSQLSHNIFIQAGAELGYAGLAAFLTLIFMTFRMNAHTRRRVGQLPDGRTLYLMALGLDAGLVGFLVSGSFVTVLYYPYFWINYAMTAALYKVVRGRSRGTRGGARSVPRGTRPVGSRASRQIADAPSG
ncbi:MAG: O-antigen ligase family protein [Gemmatimonadota bacterium]